MKNYLVVRNVSISLLVAISACALVAVENRSLLHPMSSGWFYGLAAGSLIGFIWANHIAFTGLEQPARFFARSALTTVLWLLALFAAIVIGTNFKFALGGAV
jgi:hypothetical protein